MDTKENKLASRSSDYKINNEEELECAVCLQTCVHPVRLPCSHIFCFLCVKGVANRSKRCAMCRQEIPADFLDNPHLLKKVEEKESDPEDYQWFYEGRNGWWQYDERTSRDLETAYSGGERVFEVLVAGFLYSVDFDRMVQQRRNDPSRRRRIKRDLASIPKKGVAGLKTVINLPQQPQQDGLQTTTLSLTEIRLVSSVENHLNDAAPSDDADSASRTTVEPSSLSSFRVSQAEREEIGELDYLHLLHSDLHRSLYLDYGSVPSSASRSLSATDVTLDDPSGGSSGRSCSMFLRRQYPLGDASPRGSRSDEPPPPLPTTPREDLSRSNETINIITSHITNLTLAADENEVQYYSLDDTEEYSLPSNEDL